MASFNQNPGKNGVEKLNSTAKDGRMRERESERENRLAKMRATVILLSSKSEGEKEQISNSIFILCNNNDFATDSSRRVGFGARYGFAEAIRCGFGSRTAMIVIVIWILTANCS